MAIVELKLLGPFEARDESHRPVTLPSRKVRALLAFLALHPDRRFTRAYLATLLWGEDNPDNARHSLRQALTALRRECPGLEVNTQFVRLRGDTMKVDAALIERAASSQDFDELEQAASFGDGELLEGYENDTEMFERWLYPERERLRAMSRTALESLIRLLPSRDQHERGLALARHLVNDDPFEEAAHRLYLSMLVAAGQHRAALKHYRDLREFLSRELGAEPEEETSAIVVGLAAGSAKKGREGPSVLDSLSRQLAGRVSGLAQEGWEILLVGPSGSMLDATDQEANGPAPALSQAVKDAYARGLNGGPVTLAPAADHGLCVLIPLRGPTGALDGALALVAPPAVHAAVRTKAPRPTRKGI
jgi:DNA-binding SARP family transcriptional activator